MMKHLALAFGILLCVCFVQPGRAVEPDASEQWVWEALGSKNHFAMIRHALAPGMGDPPEFTLGRRETQRNLSDKGRKQAEHIGALFRAHGITHARVFSSQWFRCLETAELLGLGPVAPLPALNSFFETYEQKNERTAALKRWLARQEMDQPLILVTHQVNITALTGVFPSSGEIVVVEKDAQTGLNIVGSIATGE